MDAIELLMEEHRTIERALDALEAFADEVCRRGVTEREELGRFVAFLRDFADEAHHGKEEAILFAAMVEHGFPSQGGPLAVMLHEHDLGRTLVRSLRARAEQATPWTDADRQAIAEDAHGFAALLHAHIHKEDAILYPMAEQHLPAEVLAAVGEACARREAERAAPQARLQALAEELVARYAPVAHPRPQRFGCGA
ncbi:MAG: hemerythrin domain-containing protein [Anaeromyxobacter sp.]